MDELLNSISTIATSLHGDRVEAIATALQRITGPENFDKCISAFGSAASLEIANDFRRAWLSYPTMTGAGLAVALRAARHTASAIGIAESVTLVWTGPKSGLIPTRNTEQVIREVIAQATKTLFIVSYVFYKAHSIVSSLNAATERGVSVRILLESSTEHGGVVTGDGLQAMHEAVPKSELFVWNPANKAETAGSFTAAVHAKCAVADHQVAFITSANLTSAAMERNMELGVLVRGGTTPNRLHSHLDALVVTGAISKWH